MNITAFLHYIETSWPMLVSVIAVLSTILYVCLSFVVSNSRDARYKEMVSDKSNSVRIFQIDVKNESVRYFNVTDMKSAKRISLTDFYRQFPPDNQPKIQNWITAIAEGRDHLNYLQTDVLVHNQRKQYFSFLQIDKFIAPTQTILIESYLLKYMPLEKNDEMRGFSTMDDFKQCLSESIKNRGATYCVNIGYKKSQLADNDIDRLSFEQFKNILATFATGHRIVLEASRDELILVDFHFSDSASILKLGNEIYNEMSRFLSVNSKANVFDIHIGIVENHYFPGDADALVSQAHRTAQFAIEASKTTYDYDPKTGNEVIIDEDNSHSEVERIISEKKLLYTFRPIFGAVELDDIGYLAKIEPRDTYFETIEEVKNYAVKTQDDRNLFATIAKNVIPPFASALSANGKMLFFPLSITEKNFVIDTFSKIARVKEIKIAFVFDESDITGHANISDDDWLQRDLTLLHSRGFQLALKIEENDLTLAPTSYALFDYFLVGFGGLVGSNADAKIRAKLHAVIEKLLKYKKPIIANDLADWMAIELVVRSGLNYISSEAFDKYDPMIMPAVPKNIARIKDMRKQ